MSACRPCVASFVMPSSNLAAWRIALLLVAFFQVSSAVVTVGNRTREITAASFSFIRHHLILAALALCLEAEGGLKLAGNSDDEQAMVSQRGGVIRKTAVSSQLELALGVQA
ncbi:unnamed protein product [Heligmosomoides polygyrus]|uniref:Secreted protein n=1 Tax=Heligmosomoides polygyrus TaxID=6339 RepID=A0A183G8F7_HELPZ|nr:unnamed protein product [Heligmosomoides polygyrus]